VPSGFERTELNEEKMQFPYSSHGSPLDEFGRTNPATDAETTTILSRIAGRRNLLYT